MIREWCVGDHEAEDDQNEDILFLPFVASSPSHLGHNPRKTSHKKTPKAQRTQKGDRRKIDEDTKKGNKCKNKNKTIGDDVN